MPSIQYRMTFITEQDHIVLDFSTPAKLVTHFNRMKMGYPDATMTVEKVIETTEPMSIVDGELVMNEKVISDDDYDHVEYRDDLPQQCPTCSRKSSPPSRSELKLKTPCCNKVMQEKHSARRRGGKCGCGREWHIQWDDDAIRFSKRLTYQEEFDKLMNEVCGDDDEKRAAVLDLVEQYDRIYRSGTDEGIGEVNEQGEALVGFDWQDLHFYHGYRDKGYF